MANGSIITNNGKIVMLNRTYKAVPDYLAPTVFMVGKDNTTPNIADTALDDPVTINGGDTKAFVAGYPTFDEVNNEVTIRCSLTTAEANGNIINGFGIFNEDGTPMMIGEDTFTGETKTNTVELAFIIKDRLL